MDVTSHPCVQTTVLFLTVLYVNSICTIYVSSWF